MGKLTILLDSGFLVVVDMHLAAPKQRLATGRAASYFPL